MLNLLFLLGDAPVTPVVKAISGIAVVIIYLFLIGIVAGMLALVAGAAFGIWKLQKKIDPYRGKLPTIVDKVESATSTGTGTIANTIIKIYAARHAAQASWDTFIKGLKREGNGKS